MHGSLHVIEIAVEAHHPVHRDVEQSFGLLCRLVCLLRLSVHDRDVGLADGLEVVFIVAELRVIVVVLQSDEGYEG